MIDGGNAAGRAGPRRPRRRALIALLALVAALAALTVPSGAEDLETTTDSDTPTTEATAHDAAPSPEVTDPAPDATDGPVTHDDPLPTASFWDHLDAAGPAEPGPATTTSAASSAAQAAVAVPLAPAITVTPATGLVEGDVVTINGTGFPANAFLAFVQCGPGTGQEACNLSNIRYVNANASGSFSMSFTPRRILRTQGVNHDCADAGACSIGGGTVPDGSGGSATASIRFDPSIPPPPPPVLTVTPTTDLLDRQSVTVTGSGFPAESPVGVVECLDPPTWNPTNCNLRNVGFTFTEADGSFSLTYQVRRLLRTDGATTDCADLGACVIAAGVNDPTDGAAVSIQFDGSVPLPPPPTVTVAPTTDLLDGDTVTVIGSGFDPGAPVFVSQCASGAEPSPIPCDTSGDSFVQADDSGGFTTDLVVDRLVYVGPDPVDCAGPGACEVVVYDLYEGYVVASVPILFDGSVPPPPPPTLVGSPVTGLVDGQTITLTGKGYPRNRQLGMAQCLTSVPNSPGCDLTNYKFVQTDDDGGFTTTFTVRATYQSAGRGPVDCRTAPGICRVGAGLTDGGLGASALLTFGGSSSPTPPAEVQAADAVAVAPAFTG